MIEWAAAIGAAIGTGFVSAVFPLVNAELATGAAAWGLERPLAWGVVVAITVGQVAGKLVVYEGARGGRRLGLRWRLARQRRRPAQPAPQPRPPGRWAALGAKLLGAMEGRWRCNAVVVLSAVVSLPPLFATSVAAGLIRMRRLDFAVCVACGRLVRFAAIAWPVLTWV